MTAPPPAPNPSAYLVLYRCAICGESVSWHTATGGCEWAGLSPLVAWAMVTALEILGDEWPDVPGDLNVPPCARRFAQDAAFCQRMKASGHYLADQLAAGESDPIVARCTADEVNLAMALTEVPWIPGVAGPVPDELREATVHGLESDADAASESLFHDHDVFMLWNPLLDGIENDDGTLARLGTADLRPSRWFEPFLYVKEPIP